MTQPVGTEKKEPFDPYIWRQNRHRQKQSYEKIRISILGQICEALTALSHQYGWEEVYVFGSVIQPGRFQPRSDIDIAIKGLDKFQLYSFISDISSSLQRDVDVIALEECPFSEFIIKKGVKWNPEKKSLYS
jgi:predicted nucleotidyltransferase